MTEMMRQDMKTERTTCPRHGLSHAVRWSDDDDPTCEACFCEYHDQFQEPIGFENPGTSSQMVCEDEVWYTN